MKNFQLAWRSAMLFGLALAVAAPLHAQPAGFNDLAAAQAAANAQPGPRKSPGNIIPVPTQDVSLEAQKLIARPYPETFNADPKNAAEWKDLIAARAKIGAAAVPAMKEKFGVTFESKVIGGVNSFIVTPRTIPDRNQNRLLVHVHGGGYVFSPGEAALPEAILLAGIGGFKVISVDYRMPPDFPYPAALDDAMAVWKEAVKKADPHNMAIFGTSPGGAMTWELVLRARDEKLPLPAAIAPGTPWSDIDKIGDSYARPTNGSTMCW